MDLFFLYCRIIEKEKEQHYYQPKPFPYPFPFPQPYIPFQYQQYPTKKYDSDKYYYKPSHYSDVDDDLYYPGGNGGSKNA